MTDKFSLFEIVERGDNPIDFAIWLQEQGFITAENRLCPDCGIKLRLHEKKLGNDKAYLMCAICHKVESIRQGSFFEDHKLSIEKTIAVARCFEEGLSVPCTASLAGVSEPTVKSLYHRFQHLTSERKELFETNKQLKEDAKSFLLHGGSITNLMKMD
jgi:transposase-like protein